jgi:hypothetical protein
MASPPAVSGAEALGPRAGETQADVRGAVHALNGTHAPAPATVLRDEPTSSVILDRSIAAELGGEGPTGAAPAPAPLQEAAVAPQEARLPQRTVGMAHRPVAAVHVAASLDASDIDFPGRSKKGLWMALGAAGVVLVGVAMWLGSSSGEKPAARPSIAATQAAPPNRIPPPPPPTPVQPAEVSPPTPTVVAAPPPPPPPPPPPAVVAAPVAPPPVAIPQAAPQRLVVPPAPRPPTWVPSVPAPARPAARPKPTGQTIVRDVPF